ncbi:lysozyme inhibitor LprI family protein [Craterilacuibacter sp. RT1T]|uniref:lysozyme inhibitor LprI family protein n=1 Tax=Craterilacuibacter sp. RT1T TaxID=2942211 RepID=UPI0020BFA9F6|nr:lysozyme inhibitor LprI family protein [Craterilacuibacter sp. RT1T]MCL6262827.1 lysozyme inhibitor LprI family protein [Craterilacuibacter sp. RT1T]
MVSAANWLLPAALLLPAGAQAFDCQRAASLSERLICAEPALIAQDKALATLYRATLAASPKPALLKTQQRAWLAGTRDRCREVSCLSAAYRTRLQALNSAWRNLSDTTLGIAFPYPLSRPPSRGCRDSKNCIALGGDPAPSLSAEVFSGAWENIATQQAVFERTAQGWVAHGRNGSYPAHALHGKGWQGLLAVVDCGISDSQGFHGAAGECLWAVVGNGRRAVVFDSQGLGGNDDASRYSISQLRFLP